MKQKILFGFQVFTTLILIITIFVSYLERDTKRSINEVESNEIQQASSNGLSGILTSSFTTAVTGVVSCGK